MQKVTYSGLEISIENFGVLLKQNLKEFLSLINITYEEGNIKIAILSKGGLFKLNRVKGSLTELKYTNFIEKESSKLLNVNTLIKHDSNRFHMILENEKN